MAFTEQGEMTTRHPVREAGIEQRLFVIDLIAQSAADVADGNLERRLRYRDAGDFLPDSATVDVSRVGPLTIISETSPSWISASQSGALFGKWETSQK